MVVAFLCLYVQSFDWTHGLVLLWQLVVALLSAEEIVLALLHSLVSAVNHRDRRLLFAWTSSRVERRNSVVQS